MIKIAKVKQPIPVLDPIVITKNSANSSRAPPTAERKRTKLNVPVPVTVTLVPRLPFTKTIITDNKLGRIVNVMTNFLYKVSDNDTAALKQHLI